MKIKTLKIDGIDISGREEQTIFEVARENNIFIPTLCYLEGLKPIGGCRVCLVEVDGKKLLPSCITKIEEGMEIRTDTEELRNYRKLIVELIFAERNHICSICVANGNCELQNLSVKLNIDHFEMPNKYPKCEVDMTHERFGMDHNRCILCARCVRVCSEIEGANTLDIMGKGSKARVFADLNQGWGSAESCTSCGKCVQVCPTGALFEKSKPIGYNKKRDFLTYLKVMRSNDL
ncbi:MAG: bidirectional hydrogenase complex protein HoxU [Calditerrivibrio sp.]|nr:bidirectional hydrogenase complex protein HoxU [Calditerrivibrio sp.]MCA1981249.1 bidirectional hydrogenase complex protein HoxU [Calditerrivibrio sp.]